MSNINKNNNRFYYCPEESKRAFVYEELERKNNQISNLKSKVNDLIEDNKYLINKITELQHQNYTQNNPSSAQLEFQQKETQLINIIKKLEEENNLLKQKLIEKKKAEEKFENTINCKLLTADNQLHNLLLLNMNKDNIINNIQNFLNNLNNIINKDKIKSITPFEFDLNKIDSKSFTIGLKLLEENIIKKLNNIPNINNSSYIYSEINTNSNTNSNINSKNNSKINNYSKITKISKHSKFSKKSKTNQSYLNSNRNNSNIRKINYSKNHLSSRSLLNKSKKTNNSIYSSRYDYSNYGNNNKNMKFYHDIRCEACKKLTKENDKYYKDQRIVKMEGYLMAKQEGGLYRTPPRDKVDLKMNIFNTESDNNIICYRSRMRKNDNELSYDMINDTI